MKKKNCLETCLFDTVSLTSRVWKWLPDSDRSVVCLTYSTSRHVLIKQLSDNQGNRQASLFAYSLLVTNSESTSRLQIQQVTSVTKRIHINSYSAHYCRVSPAQNDISIDKKRKEKAFTSFASSLQGNYNRIGYQPASSRNRSINLDLALKR